MSNGSNYVLWCINDANSAGNVCVYQDSGNVSANGTGTLDTLAWMVTGANPGTQIQFIWNINDDFVWFDDASPPTQAILSSSTGNQVTLSKNTYGYFFSSPSNGTQGQLTIKTDGSIPAVNNVVTGIGMDGAGTFAYAALPNLVYSFTPTAINGLAYWICFGYTGQVNQVLNTASLNTPQKIVFPYGVTTMTATYQIDGTWRITNGAPMSTMTTECLVVSDTGSSTTQVVVYRPGTGTN